MAFKQTTAIEIRDRLAGLLPPGPIWRFDPASRLALFLLGAGTELARVHNKIASLVDEMDPRTTDDLLTDWERVAGLPEHCDPSPPSDVATRRQLLVAKLKAVGGQTPAYYKTIADAATGQNCTVADYSTASTFVAGSPAGSAVYSPALVFWWTVSIPNTDPENFQAGSGAGSPLSVYPAGVASLACMLDAFKPAHTKFYFIYPDDDPAT